MKNIYLNIKHGTLGMRLSVLLTVIAGLLCSTSAWAFDVDGTVYYDNTYTQFENLYVGIGRSDYRCLNQQMTRVSGTQYLYSATFKWTNATNWLVTNTNWGNCASESFSKFVYLGNNNATMPWDEAFSATYVYSAGSDTEEYAGADSKTAQFYSHNAKVEYNDYLISTSVNGSGSLEVLDYDDDEVTSGTNKPYLTVLKITATPDAGYVVNSLTIAGVDYTAEARAGQFQYTVKRAAVVSVTFGQKPTVLIAEDESVSDDQVTLNGYVEYTGCLPVTEYGFVYGTGATPTTSDIKVQAGTSIIAATHYSKTFTGEDGSYNYRAYMIAGGDPYYSEEIRRFTISVPCDITTVNAAIAGGASASANIDESVALSSTTHADTYLWSVVSKSDPSATVTITNSGKRNASVSADKRGTYTLKLTAECNSSSEESSVVTLYVCAPATAQTVLLDNHSANVICDGETSTATCVSETGYKYSLYHDSENLGTYDGTGATLTWYNVAGEGTFYVKSSPDDFEQCAVSVGSATQTYNRPTINLTVNPAASVMAYKDVTISKSSTSTVDTNLTWEITTNPGDKGYMLNTTRLLYDSRARQSVIFKGGLVNNAATTYTVTGTGSRTVNIAGSSDTKTCESTGSVNIIVSPATESCN